MKGPTKHPVKLPEIAFPDGTRVGGPIPGSRYKRSVCAKCREPIRVAEPSLCDFCSDCVTPRRARDNDRPVFRESELKYHGRHIRTDT